MQFVIYIINSQCALRDVQNKLISMFTWFIWWIVSVVWEMSWTVWLVCLCHLYNEYWVWFGTCPKWTDQHVYVIYIFRSLCGLGHDVHSALFWHQASGSWRLFFEWLSSIQYFLRKHKHAQADIRIKPGLYIGWCKKGKYYHNQIPFCTIVILIYRFYVQFLHWYYSYFLTVNLLILTDLAAFYLFCEHSTWHVAGRAVYWGND